MASALLSKLASAAEYLALPGAILMAYFTTSRSTEPKRVRRYSMPSGNSSNNQKGSVSPVDPSWSPQPDRWHREPDHAIQYDDGKSREPPWYPKDRWYGNGVPEK